MKYALLILLFISLFQQLSAGDFSVAPRLVPTDKQTGKPRAEFLPQVDELFIIDRRDEVGASIQSAEELIESALMRMQFREKTHVPFAYNSGRVSLRFHQVPNGLLFTRKTKTGVFWIRFCNIVLKPKSVLVFPG